ncbi:hypothetical protein PCH_Pc21g16490 [Penicillium rubens Wisconsin 54-1255]|uniref:Uncharacterized protein n=1 Tax=Penicillium rubens (strain ATCC 28089 / DSM 1075 / NRRL 1951 / Wisconsin 54-1255) TaxID=500485 RepID=B6HLC5_PENRW|nr:hypothetical protein PCH_Pc21g16490 [Penicillium rubens Wisconsin 54-1255]
MEMVLAFSPSGNFPGEHQLPPLCAGQGGSKDATLGRTRECPREKYRGKCGNLPEHPPGSSALLPHTYINGESSTGIKDATMYIELSGFAAEDSRRGARYIYMGTCIYGVGIRHLPRYLLRDARTKPQMKNPVSLFGLTQIIPGIMPTGLSILLLDSLVKDRPDGPQVECVGYCFALDCQAIRLTIFPFFKVHLNILVQRRYNSGIDHVGCMSQFLTIRSASLRDRRLDWTQPLECAFPVLGKARDEMTRVTRTSGLRR